eukprot:7475646-Prorocentrum_lima.AAC.1
MRAAAVGRGIQREGPHMAPPVSFAWPLLSGAALAATLPFPALAVLLVISWHLHGEQKMRWNVGT